VESGVWVRSVFWGKGLADGLRGGVSVWLRRWGGWGLGICLQWLEGGEFKLPEREKHSDIERKKERQGEKSCK